MNYLFSCHTIPFRAFNLSNSWDIHPFLGPEKTIFQSRYSLERSGLIYLPLVIAASDGSYEIITGKRCLDVSQRMVPKENILCRVVTEGVTPAEILVLLYEEHTMRGEMTVIEMAHFVRICRNRLDEQEQHTLFTSVGLPDKSYFFDRLAELLTLEHNLQSALMEGRLTEGMARELLRLQQDDRLTFYDLVMQLAFGGGKQKRLLSLLKDLAGRSGLSFHEYLGEAAIRSILDHKEMNIPQKGQVLLQQLQQLYSPALAMEEERFAIWKQRLGLPSNCTVEHSPSFEQDDVSLTLRFNNRQYLEKFLERSRDQL